MKYSTIKKGLFIENRKNFSKHIKSNSLALFVSNDFLPTNGDGSFGFVQNSDLFYLTGVDQEDTILMIFPDVKDGKNKEVLFIKETSELIAIWEGAKLTKKQATEVSGIENVFWFHEFEKTFKTFAFQAENFYLNSNEHTRRYIDMETAEMRFNHKLRTQFPLHTIMRSAPIMHRIRSIKHPIEIELMQQACNITEKGFRRLLNYVKPGVMEYEIEAELIHEFVRNRSRGFAYVENNMPCKDGDVILLDVAAEYANYASDMTRAIPVSGKFTARQRQVYDAVLRVMKGATAMLKVGNTFEKYNIAVGDLMTEELLQLGLLKTEDVKNQNPAWPAYKKYFMHGTSHFIGLDVHDVGFFAEPMQIGNAFTVEPGIYIPEENLGIRLENNIIITANGNDDLMKNIPLEAEEIEALMGK
jgi:Xaa-Pro aminopeptidase